MLDNRPLSEQWHDAALKAQQAEAAAHLLEETKSAVLSQMMLALGDMPVSRAEMLVKGSKGWEDTITKICEARDLANVLRVERDFLKMKFNEWVSADANERVQARL